MGNVNPDKDKMKESFQNVYEEYYNSLVGFAESYVVRRDVAEDIVQEIFVSLGKGNSFSFQGCFEYLFIYFSKELSS